MRCEVSPEMLLSGNDNNLASWLTDKGGWTDSVCIPHIRMANWLIGRYSPKAWKETIYNYDYQFRHWCICLHLATPIHDRDFMLETLAMKLECNPILLLNSRDPTVVSLFSKPDIFKM